MKVEYINPFIQAAQSVIKSLCRVDAKLGKIYLRSSPFTANQIIIIIGIVGKIKGQVYFELSKTTAEKIASVMMGGVQINELDEISKSALSEMGNMIVGNAGIIFGNNKIHIDITPPALLVGDRIEMSNRTPTVVIPLQLNELGEIKINVNMQEND